MERARFFAALKQLKARKASGNRKKNAERKRRKVLIVEASK
jgi:hypothetical protein